MGSVKPSDIERLHTVQDIISSCHLDVLDSQENLRKNLFDIAVLLGRIESDTDVGDVVEVDIKELMVGDKNLRGIYEDFCKRMILEVYRRVGSKGKTKAILNCSRTTVWKHLKKAA